MMKAVVQDKYGTPDDVLQLQEINKPVVGDNDVLVRVCAASVHPDVWHVVTGRPYVLRLMGAGLLKPKNPVPGTDVAGLVESVGKNVTRFGAGDEVFGETHLEHQWRNGGAFAEFVSVPQDALAHKPIGITFEQAAAGRIFGSLPRVLKLVALSPFVSQLPDLRLSVPSKKDIMAVLKESLEAGKLTPIIDRTYALSGVSEAMRYLQAGHARGKIIITP